MSNSLFCPNCGMLKNNCVCGITQKNLKSNYSIDSNDISSSILNMSSTNIDNSYSIGETSIAEERINELKKEFRNIDNEII